MKKLKRYKEMTEWLKDKPIMEQIKYEAEVYKVIREASEEYNVEMRRYIDDLARDGIVGSEAINKMREYGRRLLDG